MAKQEVRLENLAAEQMVLGKLLQSEASFWSCADVLQAQHFSKTINQRIYQAINDILTEVGGTGPITARFTVTGIDGGGGVTSVSVNREGVYLTTPSNPVSVTGGGGTGCTLNVTYSQSKSYDLSGGDDVLTTPGTVWVANFGPIEEFYRYSEAPGTSFWV